MIEISLYKIPILLFSKPCIKSKITCQLYWKPQVRTIRLGYRIYVNIEKRKNIYVFAWGYKYFFLAVYTVTILSFLKFIKKKSETLLFFIDWVTFFKRKYNANFAEFNSAIDKAYFTWKRSNGRYLPLMHNNKMA